MARVDRCGSPYASADSQFRSLAEYQLQGTYRLAPRPILMGISSCPSRSAESLDAGGPIQLVAARHICGGCNNYRVATRQSQTGAGSWWKHYIASRPGKRASGGDDVGNFGDTANGKLVLFNSC